MACSMCESHINDTVRRNFDIKKVTSSHTKGETVILSENELDRDKLVRVISETGYEPRDIVSAAEEKKKGFLSNLFGK